MSLINSLKYISFYPNKITFFSVEMLFCLDNNFCLYIYSHERVKQTAHLELIQMAKTFEEVKKSSLNID